MGSQVNTQKTAAFLMNIVDVLLEVILLYLVGMEGRDTRG